MRAAGGRQEIFGKAATLITTPGNNSHFHNSPKRGACPALEVRGSSLYIVLDAPAPSLGAEYARCFRRRGMDKLRIRSSIGLFARTSSEALCRLSPNWQTLARPRAEHGLAGNRS